MRFYPKSFILMIAVSFPACALSQGTQARAYYDELYKVGGLDRLAGQYVCFDENPDNHNFFIFATSDALKAAFIEHKQYDGLPPGARAMFRKGFVYVRGYNKGVPLGNGDDQYIKDGESWLSDPFRFDKVTTGRMRLRVSFDTLRYRRAVEVTKDHATHEAATSFGKCEPISAAVEQNAK